MPLKLTLNKKIILILPALAVFIFHCFAMLNVSSFYNSRIDPDYPYLLNGLNCALGEFSRIGHTDHPGTPFQMLTGFFILILHFFFGQGDLAYDVISRPEFYLTGSSFLLTVLATIVTLYVTLKVYSLSQNFAISFFIGSSLLLYKLAMNLTIRYIPDYFLLIIILLLTVPIVQYIFNPKYSSTKFIIFTGILTGIGGIAKVVFAPLVFIPFLLVDKIKNKLLFSFIFAVSAFVNFLPILSKHAHVRRFLMGVTQHDGLYGKGEQQFLNIDTVFHSLKLFASDATWFIVVFLGVVIFLIVSFTKHKLAFLKDRTNKFLLAFLFSTSIGLLLTFKHYKNYYTVSFLAIAIIAYAVLWLKVNEVYKNKKVINGVFISLALIHFFIQANQKLHQMKYQHSVTQNKNMTDALLKNYIDPNGFKIIKPSWFHSLTVDGGLAYGLSYTAKNRELYNEFNRAYPKTLTWEGKDKPLRFLRITPFLNNVIFYSGEKVYLMDGPQNNTTEDVISFLKAGSEVRNIEYNIDTVFHDKQFRNYLIEYTNKSLWHCVNSTKCGFEIVEKEIIMANDAVTRLTNDKYQRDEELKSMGAFSLRLSDDIKLSPGIFLDTLNTRDYLKVTVKIKGKLPKNIKEILSWNGMNITNQNFIIIDSAVNDLGDYWNLIQLGITCTNNFDSTSYINIQNSCNTPMYIDDFELDHYSSKAN